MKSVRIFGDCKIGPNGKDYISALRYYVMTKILILHTIKHQALSSNKNLTLLIEQIEDFNLVHISDVKHILRRRNKLCIKRFSFFVLWAYAEMKQSFHYKRKTYNQWWIYLDIDRKIWSKINIISKFTSCAAINWSSHGTTVFWNHSSLIIPQQSVAAHALIAINSNSLHGSTLFCCSRVLLKI
jgi:hypothetical protein